MCGEVMAYVARLLASLRKAGVAVRPNPCRPGILQFRAPWPPNAVPGELRPLFREIKRNKPLIYAVFYMHPLLREVREYPPPNGQPDPLDYRWNPDRQQWEYYPGWWRELLTGPG